MKDTDYKKETKLFFKDKSKWDNENNREKLKKKKIINTLKERRKYYILVTKTFIIKK